MNLVLAAVRFTRPRLRVARDTVPFLLLNGRVMLVITYLPAFSLWLVER